MLFCKCSQTKVNCNYQLKIGFVCVYTLTLFISLRVVAATLPITAKLALILKLELVNTKISHL